jgi:hypothetical protein
MVAEHCRSESTWSHTLRTLGDRVLLVVARVMIDAFGPVNHRSGMT